MKTCTKCHNEYPATLEYWHRRSYSIDGLHYYCKACSNAISNKSKHKIRNTDIGRARIQAANRENTRQYYKTGKYHAYLATNPIAKLRTKIHSLLISSIHAKGWSKTTKTQALLGCDFEFLMRHLKASLPDYENHEIIHIDHILPCSAAENEDELNALQHYTNLQWLPGAENLSKSSTLPNDWQARKAKLMEIYWSRTVAK